MEEEVGTSYRFRATQSALCRNIVVRWPHPQGFPLDSRYIKILYNNVLNQ